MAMIQTIKGSIRPEDAGATLVHEHLLGDQRPYGEVSPDISKRVEYAKPVSLENRGDVEMRPFFYHDDLMLTDLDTAIAEAKEFKYAGGSTIVDLTAPGLGRDIDAFYKLALSSDLNVVFSTGLYIAAFWTEAQKRMSDEDLAKTFIAEFRDGIGFFKRKPGIIGEIGMSSMKDEYELRCLRAAAKTQKAVGCALNIHPVLFTADGKYAHEGHAILDVIEENGGDIRKTALSHCDLTFRDVEYHASLAERGAFIEFDQFGMYAMAFSALPGLYLPCDIQRCDAVKKLIDMGYLDRLLISHDVGYKHLTKKYGGKGFAHIIRNIIPMMRDYAGITEEQIYTMLVENPKKLLAF